MKKSSVMKWLGIAFFVLVIYNIANSYLKKSNAESAVVLKEMLVRSYAIDSIRQTTSDIHRGLPQKFTNGNSLDEIKFDEKNKQVLYYFTYENLDSSSKAEISNIQIEMNQQTINFWKNNESKYAFINARVSNKYLIFDKTKKEVFNFTVKPEDMQ